MSLFLNIINSSTPKEQLEDQPIWLLSLCLLSLSRRTSTEVRAKKRFLLRQRKDKDKSDKEEAELTRGDLVFQALMVNLVRIRFSICKDSPWNQIHIIDDTYFITMDPVNNFPAFM